MTGVTLRDYFAAAAISSIRGSIADEEYRENAAVLAYKMADAMLEARKKGK